MVLPVVCLPLTKTHHTHPPLQTVHLNVAAWTYVNMNPQAWGVHLRCGFAPTRSFLASKRPVCTFFWLCSSWCCEVRGAGVHGLGKTGKYRCICDEHQGKIKPNGKPIVDRSSSLCNAFLYIYVLCNAYIILEQSIHIDVHIQTYTQHTACKKMCSVVKCYVYACG